MRSRQQALPRNACLLGVERAILPRDALADDLCGLVDEYRRLRLAAEGPRLLLQQRRQTRGALPRGPASGRQVALDEP